MLRGEVLSGTSFFMSTNVRRRIRIRGDSLFLLVVIAFTFLLAHPFTGVRHDGILYAGDALARLLPGEFHDDLYFVFGSQGRFTLLPSIYARLIGWFGLGAGTMIGLLIASALYLLATLFVVNRLAPRDLRAYCALSVILGWSIYGGLRVFGYAEPFLTARNFAEPFVLFALGLALRDRLSAAVISLIVALLIHPLIGACGIAVLWLLAVQRDWRWAWLAIVGVMMLLVLGLLGIGQFSDLYERYDATWLALVQEANVHAFVSRWALPDFSVMLYALIALTFAYHVLADPSTRRVIVAVIATAVASVLASFLLVDLAHSVFFGKLQIWRALWLMQWLAMATLPLSLTALWARDAHGRACAILMAIGWIVPFSIVAGPVAVLALAIDRSRTKVTLSRITVRILVAALVATIAIVAGQYEFRVLKMGMLLSQSWASMLGQVLALNVLLMFIGAYLVHARRRFGKTALVVAVALFVAAAFLWDQRSPWTRQLEARPLDDHIWPGLIEPTARVYWYRDMIAPWVLLGHANFYAQQQGSGAVFSREMTVELDKRRHIAAMLDMQEQICRIMNNLNSNASSCEPDVDASRTICTDGKVDYVVLQSRLEGARPLADFSTGVVENGYEKKFYLYRCSALKPG